MGLHAAVVAVVGMMVFGCYWMVDLDRDVYSHIVKGRCPKLPKTAYRLNRTEDRAAVQKAILHDTREFKVAFYHVVTGPHGCGKSFLVQETVLELMTNSTPVPGLLYLVPKEGYPIANVIRDVLVENGNTWLAAIRQIVRVTNLYSLPDDPKQGMETICDRLKQLGGKLKEEYGRPLVIVVDDVNKLIQFEDFRYPGQFKVLDTMDLDYLQSCARRLANSGSVQFMFIDSGGVALPRLRHRFGFKQGWSRLKFQTSPKSKPKAFYNKDSVLKTNMSVDKIYEQLTGGRLILLYRIIALVHLKRLKTFEDLYDTIIAETKWGSLQPCGLNVKKSTSGKGSKEKLMRSTIITEMFKNDGQLATKDMNKLMEVDSSLTWEEVIELMVKKDILMFVGSGEVVKFHSVAIETAFKELGY